MTREFKKNTAQEHYRGLTYDFMREYIRTHETDATPVLAELDDQIGISKCHSLGKRYPTIKAWFLERYPAIAAFGMSAASKEAAPEGSKVVESPALSGSSTEDDAA